MVIVMKKIKVKPLKIPKGAPIFYISEWTWHEMVTREKEKIKREHEREFYGDIWGRMLASLRGETYASD